MSATTLRLIDMGITTESRDTRPYQSRGRRGEPLDPSSGAPSHTSYNFTLLYPIDQGRPTWNTMWDRPPPNPESTDEDQHAASTPGEMAHLFHSPTATLMRGPPQTNHRLVNGLRVPQRPKATNKTPEITINPGDMTHLFHSPTADLMRGPRQTDQPRVNGLRVPKRFRRPWKDTGIYPPPTEELVHIFP